MENPYCRCFNAPKKRSRAAILQPDAGVDASTAASTMGWARIAESGGGFLAAEVDIPSGNLT